MKETLIPRKDTLILAVIDVIDQSGIQGLTIREIAKKAGITEGAIFKHYKSKNELILAVLDYFSMFDDEIKCTVRLKNMPPKQAIAFFMGSYIDYYENYPAITALSEAYNELASDPELAEVVRKIYLDRSAFVKMLVEEAQQQGEISAGLDSENIADVIIGLFRAICLKWRFNNYSFSLKERCQTTLNMVLDSLWIGDNENER